jgi:hypothetical protein
VTVSCGSISRFLRIESVAALGVDAGPTETGEFTRLG